MKADYSTHLAISYGLWFFWGIFGAHRFFNGHWVSGILMACTGGMCGIWWVIDAFLMPSIVKENLSEL
tara:strand:+ start:1292 stop:1495 length:204 start_codon:yes stop_codon:yes gene_type:complete